MDEHCQHELVEMLVKVILGTDVIRYPLTGIGRYAYEIGSGLVKTSQNVDPMFFYKNHLSKKLPMGAFSDRHSGHHIFRSLANLLTQSKVILNCHRIVSDVIQQRRLEPYKDAVFHGPNFYLPKHSGPCVSTFHDLSVVQHPEFHPSARVRYMLDSFPKALNRATLLLTISEHARIELVNYSGFSPEKVICTPLAASPDFYPRLPDDCFSVLQKYVLNYKKFFLFVGTIEPRKNISVLLDAYERTSTSFRYRYPLVVVGYHGWNSEHLHKRLLAAQAAGWVKYLGFASASDLPILYSSARAFVFPSRYEGFGLPILEAMASGVPVICSNSTSLPEVAGGHALMCDPDDVETLTELIVKAADDDDWRQVAITGGIEHASTYSWGKTVEQTINAYRIASSL